MKEIIKNIILENRHSDLPNFKKRNIIIPLHQNIIISLIGARRSGKTYILYQLINKLLEEGINKNQILFINFEDERLNLKSENLDLILQAYQEITPEISLNNVYLFFDEIQNITGWEKFVRRIYDTKTRNIFITGSNSKLLSTEIATELRGRTLTYTIYPLNFKEYLSFNNVEPNLYPQKNKSKILYLQQKYMLDGAFPEILNFDDFSKKRMLQQYFNVMIFRDIIERYNISNVETLKFFIKKIFASITKPFSVNKAYNDLKSMGYTTSNKYLYEYFDYCNAVFLSQNINKFNFSEIKQEKSDKKAYIIDTGLICAVEFSISQNFGKLFENMVALELLKNENQIYYFKNNYECDFIVQNNNTFVPIQVCYTFEDSETKERELRGLNEACQFLKTKTGTILTFDTEEELVYKDFDIKIIPFYKFFT